MITLKPAETAEEVDSILKDPELFERISSEDLSVEDYNAVFDDHNIYMVARLKDVKIGLYHLHPHNPTTLIIHCNFLKGYRDHADESQILLYKWILDECDNTYQKVIAEIPYTYPEVYHFSKKFGFVDEGVNRSSVLKNGKIVDQWRVGITREEISQWLQR